MEGVGLVLSRGDDASGGIWIKEHEGLETDGRALKEVARKAGSPPWLNLSCETCHLPRRFLMANDVSR